MELQLQGAHNGVNNGRWLKSLHGKGMHKRHSYAPETQLMIWVWSLVHECVATVAVLAKEMTSKCDTAYMYVHVAISHEGLANHLW